MDAAERSGAAAPLASQFLTLQTDRANQFTSLAELDSRLPAPVPPARNRPMPARRRPIRCRLPSSVPSGQGMTKARRRTRRSPPRRPDRRRTPRRRVLRRPRRGLPRRRAWPWPRRRTRRGRPNRHGLSSIGRRCCVSRRSLVSRHTSHIPPISTRRNSAPPTRARPKRAASNRGRSSSGWPRRGRWRRRAWRHRPRRPSPSNPAARCSAWRTACPRPRRRCRCHGRCR